MVRKPDLNTYDFAHERDFYRAVINHGYGYSSDPRLMAAASTIATEQLGADGGFIVPPTYRDRMIDRLKNSSILARVDKQPIAGGGTTFAKDDTPPWDTANGIQVRWEREASTLQQSKPNLGALSLKPVKIAGLVPASEELFEDSSCDRLINDKAPEKFDYAIGEAVISGTGVGMPLGILNSPALVTVAPEGAQTADTINEANVTKMFGRVWVGGYSNLIALAHPDALHQIAQLDSNVFTPGDKDAPAGRLMGAPIVPHEACSQLGDLGDLIFADLSQYCLGLRSPEIKTALSFDVWFDRHLAALRFTWRVDGAPWWAAPQVSRVGGNTRSPFVALGAR